MVLAVGSPIHALKELLVWDLGANERGCEAGRWKQSQQ